MAKKIAAQRRIVNVPIAEIRTDHLVQPRARLDPGIISEYADLMGTGAEFPPVTVVRADGTYLLAEGYLRYEAAKLANQKTLRCEVRPGDLREALLISAQANAQHGLR
jgi:ParB-like chromosome segregation protein Spo0J